LTLLRRLISARECDALLVTRQENRRYLSGFTGSHGMLLVTADEVYLITDRRYETQAPLEAPGCKLVLSDAAMSEALPGLCRERGLQALGFEQDHLTYRQYETLRGALDGVRLVPVFGLVERLRLVKDDEEIALIQEAGVITGAAFWYILGSLHYGQTELEIAGGIEYFMRSHGSGPPAFETIVAAGERGAMPHGTATDNRIASGQLVVIDYGGNHGGYTADFTRTICIGRCSARQRQVYEVVLDAQRHAMEAIRPGVAAGEVDAAARQVIADAGYGEYFSHALGHGLGLSIHEAPRLGPKQELTLRAGMVTTVEPGIYLPGWGGVRIEDTVVVTNSGCEVLTPVTRDFLVI
jgi:Xaa-Pro aminopeptidase